MESSAIFKDLIELIEPQLPPGSNMVEEIENVLKIERFSVYRRLRGEVPFSFHEIIKLAKKYQFSIDSVARRFVIEEHVFTYPILNYVYPSKMEYEIMEIFLSHLKLIRQKNMFAQTVEVCNFLPIEIFYKYESITRFYLFKWLYQYSSFKDTVSYKNVQVESRLRKIQLEHHKAYEDMSEVHYVMDNLIFFYMINDLKYFSEIYLITEEEISLIKQDLLDIVENMEESAINGKNPKTGKDFLLYISHINIDTNYFYIKTKDWQLTAIKLFMLGYAASPDKQSFEDLQAWIESQKRHSILISGCNELQRRLFFERQKKLIQSL